MIPGLKVHWRDVEPYFAREWPVTINLLEVHLDPADVTTDRQRVVETFAPLADRYLLAVHQPFTVRGVSLDPLALDPAVARASREALALAGELAADIDASFLVVHPGGLRLPGEPAAPADDARAWLADFESPAPLLLENMPAWYHHPDGTTGTCTLGRTAEELLLFEDLVAGYCLDTSHAWGARLPGSAQNVRDLLALGERIRHVHAAGSGPPDREGIPFEGSEVTAPLLREIAQAVGANVAAVPEIKGGHLTPQLFGDALGYLDAAGCFPPG